MKESGPSKEKSTSKASHCYAALCCLGRYGRHISLVLLLLLTLYVVSGRHLISFVDVFTENLEARLSLLIGEPVIITKLDGDWYQFGPVLTVDTMEVSFPNTADSEQSKFHRLESLSVEFDILQSLKNRSLIIKQVTLDQLRLELVEDQTGAWSLAGLSRDSQDADNSALLDFLLNTTKIQLVEADLIFQRANGTHFELNNIYLQLLNSELEHLLQVQLRLDGQESLIRLDLSLAGDPRGEYSGSAYTNFNSVDFTNVMAEGMAGSWLTENAVALSRMSTSAQLWLEFDQHGASLAQGNLDNIVIQGESEKFDLGIDFSSGSVGFSVFEKADNFWQVWLDDLEFDWHQRPWLPSVLFAEIDAQGDFVAFDVSAESIDLRSVKDILEELSLPASLVQALADLQPSGQLNNVRFNTDLSGEFPGGFKLAANLQNVEVGAWSGAPAGVGINGYVEASQFNGFVELDSSNFGLYLPKVFEHGWQYDSINTRVHWLLTEEAVWVNSSIIDVMNEDIHSRVKFDLYNARTLDGGWNSDLSLLVGVSEFDASKKSDYLPTLENIKATMSWLDGALLSGNVENSGFIFRGNISGDAPTGSSTIQTYYNIDNAELRFLEEWPTLQNLKAFVKVDNNNAVIFSESADFFGIELEATQGTIKPNASIPGAWLKLQGKTSTNADIGLMMLRETPIRDNIGDFINDWQADGNIDVSIDLAIPLNNDTLENVIQVAVVSTESKLTIPDYKLSFEAIDGKVDYHSESGLSSNDLTAQLFGFPILVKIDNALEDNMQGTRIVGNGVVSSLALQNWQGQSSFVKNVLGFTQGKVEYESELSLFSNENEQGFISVLKLKSDLLDLVMNLPEPFAKNVDQRAPLLLEIGFLDTLEIFTVEYDDVFHGRMLLEGENLESGQLYFGELNKDFAIRQASNVLSKEEKGLLISGELEYVNFASWLDISESFVGATGETSTVQLDEIIRLVDLSIGQLDVYDFALDAVGVLANRNEQSWQVALENELLSGDFIFPDEDSKPFDIRLNYLRFPITEEDDHIEEDALADVDPRKLPNIDFSTAELSIGGISFGVLEFVLRSNDKGAMISDLIMKMDQAVVIGQQDGGGANIEWLESNGNHTSIFTGTFLAEDLSQVLASWGYAAHVQSESAEFISNLQWSASPIEFSLLTAVGQLEVNIQNGSFVDVESGSARLFGAFNFDSIERRLQLDFSDVYQKGLAYDAITGKLKIDNGLVYTDGKFLIQGPSSTINIEGELNLRDETINADMLVNLPFSQNIAVVAGVLGAWPVAIGAYVAGKIFKDQLAQFTTVLYHLDGPWSDLSAGFESDAKRVEDEMEEVGVGVGP